MINQLNILTHTGRYKKKSSLLRMSMLMSAKKVAYTVHPFIWWANITEYLLCARYYDGSWNPQTTGLPFMPSRILSSFRKTDFYMSYSVAWQKHVHWGLNPFLSLPQHSDPSLPISYQAIKEPVSGLGIWLIFSHPDPQTSFYFVYICWKQ